MTGIEEISFTYAERMLDHLEKNIFGSKEKYSH